MLVWPGIQKETQFKIKMNLNVSGYDTAERNITESLNLFHQELSG